MFGRSVELWIGFGFLVLSLVAVFVWVPFDSETPPIYEFRRNTYIGDAMLPMVAASGIVLCAAVHCFLSFRRRDDKGGDGPLDAMTFIFFAAVGGICVSSFALMYWAGPAAVALFGPSGEEAVTYRQLRGTVPWKYIGFILGGFTLVFGITSLIEGRLSAKRALSSLLAVIVLILIFDVPFDTILLPPNGDF